MIDNPSSFMVGINIALAIHIIFVLAVVLRVLSREYLSPVKRLAWLLVLFVLPVGGIVLYALFGEAHLLNAKKKHLEIFDQIHKLNPTVLGNNDDLDDHVKMSYRAPFQYARSINGFGLTRGNLAELMPDAKTARKRMIADIDGATASVNILYYIWLEDETGTETAKALIRAAGRGIKCRVMADGMGSRKLIASKLWREMQSAGVELSVALPLTQVIRTLFRSRIDIRNHRKITIIDSEITWCGSQNCADPEFRPKKKYAPWVDIMLRFKGPVVAQNQLLFGSDWLMQNDGKLEDFVTVIKPYKTGFAAQVWGDGPADRMSTSPQLLMTLINAAQKSLTISTPYFVPEETVLGALYSAAHRGLDVTIIFPHKNDSWVVRAASQSYYLELLEAGITIYEYKGGLLHAKTMTIDDHVTMIGSTNIDMRSFDLNYENNIILYDTAMTKAVRERQQDYIESSEKVTLEKVNTWSLPKRIGINLIAAAGPVL